MRKISRLLEIGFVNLKRAEGIYLIVDEYYDLCKLHWLFICYRQYGIGSYRVWDFVVFVVRVFVLVSLVKFI